MKQLYGNFQNILIALAILSGVLNSFINLYFFSINITLLTVVLLCLDILYNIFTRKIVLSNNYAMVLLAIGCFYGLMIFSLIYSPSLQYKYVKTTNFIVNCVFFLYPLVVKKFDFDKIFTIVKFVSIFLAIFFIYERYRYWLPSNTEIRNLKTATFSKFAGIYLGIGVNLSITLLYDSFKKKWIYVILMLALMLGMGSRGSFLFSLVTLFVFHFRKWIFTVFYFKVGKKILLRRTVVSLGLLVVLSVISFKYFDKIINMIQMGLGRFESLLNFSEDQSSLVRIAHYKMALSNIFSNPLTMLFGLGIGSYGIINYNRDMRLYPHNIFLEAWFELGLIGMVLLIIIVVYPLISIRNKIALQAINFFLFLGAMKSSSIVDLWIYFLFLGLLLVYKPEDKDKIISIKSTI